MTQPSDGIKSSAGRSVNPAPLGDPDGGGDPVCWLDKVCPGCGLLTGDRPSATCPRCGEDLAAG
jgi:hypothetical protein